MHQELIGRLFAWVVLFGTLTPSREKMQGQLMFLTELFLLQSALLPAFHQWKHVSFRPYLCHRFFKRSYNGYKPIIKADSPDGYGSEVEENQENYKSFHFLPRLYAGFCPPIAATYRKGDNPLEKHKIASLTAREQQSRADPPQETRAVERTD
jgi:hypothetical protein